MNYSDGQKILLNDFVTVKMPNSIESAKVIMLGDTGEHIDLDEDFLQWVEKEDLLDENSVLIKFINGNPFAHNDPNYASVSDKYFTTVDEGLSLVKRK